MIDLDRRYGPCSGRVWGLIFNLIGNVIAVYGLAGFLREGSGILWLGLGIALSISCILLLARSGVAGSDLDKTNGCNKRGD